MKFARPRLATLLLATITLAACGDQLHPFSTDAGIDASIASDGSTDATVAIDAPHGAPDAAIDAAIDATTLDATISVAADDQSVTTDEDTSASITLSATTSTSDQLTYAIISQPTNGTLTGTAPNLTYTPAANYNGSDAFTFTASDGTVVSSIATVSITVTPVVDPPIALAQAVTVALNSPAAITLTATNVDGGDLTFSITTVPKHGDLTGDAPNVVYTPHADFFGIDTFVFNVEDATGDDSHATVSITVTPPVFTPGIHDVLAAGANHSCAMAGGGVQCWGDNTFGQLGDGTTTQRNAPVAVANLTTGVQAIAAGSNHTCAIVNGGVWCWGNNSHGQLGDTTTTSSDVPVQVPTLLRHVQSITAGGDHTCALVSSGAWCWGQGDSGQLGNNATEDSAVPVGVFQFGAGVQAISAGLKHTCAIVDGGANCWGDNSNGQLASALVTSSPTPLGAGFLDNGVASISAGATHTCAVQNGSAICWGLNDHGQLGNNSTEKSTDTVQVAGLGSGVQSISASSAGNHTCAVTNGGAWCWGQNDNGQTGIPSHIERHVPTAVPNLSGGVQAIETGGSHTCALVDGHVQCWGAGNSGQLGDGAATASTSAVQATGLTYGIAEVAVGDLFGCEIVNGGIYCWGDDQSGETGSYPAVRADGSPIGVTNISSGAEQVANGGASTCALVNGGVWCWGNNQYGQCGDGTNIENDVPVSVLGLDSGVQAIAVGMYHACALKDGDVFCWGYSSSGALGDGDLRGDNNTGFKSTPVQVGIGGVQAIAAGVWSTCALVGGNVICWGLTYQSDPDSGFDETFPTPTGIDGLDDGTVTALAAGSAITQCAVVNGGEQCWGNNPDGELGVNSVIGSPTPASVIGLENDAGVQAIGTGGSQSCAVVDGTLECSGLNQGTFANGMLNDTHLTLSPSLITSGIQQISMMFDTVCALIDGQVQCWGDNHDNALGIDASYANVSNYSLVAAPLQSWAP